MNCLICRQAETSAGLTVVIFERGELKYVMNNVPARVCPHCGDVYVDDVVAERLLRGADEMALAGELSAVREYESL
jgi:YgiT-type zinc finger domain-containing protein